MTVKQIKDAIRASGRITQDCTLDEAAALLIAIRDEAWDNKLQLSPVNAGVLLDIAWSLSNKAQRKGWGKWADNVLPDSPDLDLSQYLSTIGKKGGSSTSDKKRKSSADNLARARAEGKKGGYPKGRPRKPKIEVEP